MKRRELVAGLGCLLVVGLLLSCRPSATPDPMPEHAPAGPVNVQVSGHPDDDILFMNPDLAAGLRAGVSTVGIYVTAGESDLPNRAEYSASRQKGTRAAYAQMAGLPDDWESHPLVVDEHHAVEVYQMRANPAIKAVFMNLPDNNDPAADYGKNALVHLWSQDRTIGTLVPAGGVVNQAYTYDRDELITVLAELFQRFAPTAIRAQDPEPDARYQDDWPGWHDHPDHVVAARAAGEAAARYRDTAQARPFNLVNYRDYNGRDAPADLAPRVWEAKRDAFAAYVPHDSQAGLGGTYDLWIKRTYYRWPSDGRWAVRDRQGHVHAYAVISGRLVHWQDGQGPEPVRGAPDGLAPALNVTGPDPVVFARRADPPSIVAISGNTVLPWGNPNGTDPGVGLPCATTDSSGQHVVFVKNAGGGVSARDEGTQTWTDLGGTDVQDGLACLTGPDGVTHVLAATRGAVLHWAGHAGNMQRQADPAPGLIPAGPPSAAASGDGRLWLAVKAADTADVVVITPDGRRMTLPAPGGAGATTITATSDGAIVVGRDERAQTVFAVISGNQAAPWTTVDGPVDDQPAVVGDELLSIAPGEVLRTAPLRGKPQWR